MVTARLGRRERSLKIFLALVAAALGLSIFIPFAMISVRDGAGEGMRWVLDGSGVIGALLGCLFLAPVIRRLRGNRDPESPGEPSPPDSERPHDERYP